MSDSDGKTPPLRASDRLRLAADVRFRTVVEEGVVLRQQSAEVLIVNEVGARCLDLVGPERSIEKITDQLEDEFEVERAVLERDVATFLGELLSTGVVERVEGESA